MSTQTTRRTRTITLTDRPPVRIVEEDWPIIAEAYGDSYVGSDYSRHQQARAHGEVDRYTLRVRQHANGRTLVYGVLDAADAAWGAPACGKGWRGGELLAGRYAVERGSYLGTSDDRIDRWYIRDRESAVVDRRGPGYATQADAWAGIAQDGGAAPSATEIIAAMHSIADGRIPDDVIRECIADLPAETI